MEGKLSIAIYETENQKTPEIVPSLSLTRTGRRSGQNLAIRESCFVFTNIFLANMQDIYKIRYVYL